MNTHIYIPTHTHVNDICTHIQLEKDKKEKEKAKKKGKKEKKTKEGDRVNDRLRFPCDTQVGVV
jgi:hypothetical protein